MRVQNRYRFLFLGAFLLGTLAIIVSAAFSGGLGRAVSLVPVLVMVIYCLMIWEGGRLSEEAGDSLYYLGFAFTLVALIVAMAGAMFGEEALELRLIVKAFGVALSTTVIGLVGRVVLLSFVDERLGRETQEVAHEEAMAALQDLQVQTRETVQALSEWRRQAAEHWRSVRDEEMRGVSQTLMTHQRLLDDQVALSEASLTALHATVTKSCEDATSRVKAVAVEVTGQVKELVIASVGEVLPIVTAARKAMEDAFRGVSGQLEQERKSAQESANLTTVLLRSTVTTFQESTRVTHEWLQTSLAQWAAGIEQGAAAIGERAAGGIAGASARIVEASAGIVKSIDGVAQDLKRIHFNGIDQALKEGQALIVGGFATLSQRVGGLGDQLVASFPTENQYRNVFDALNVSVLAMTEQNRDAMNRVQIVLEEIGGLFTRIKAELKDAGLAVGLEEMQLALRSSAQSMGQQTDSLTSAGRALAQLLGDLSRATQGASALATALESSGAAMTVKQGDFDEFRRRLSTAMEGMVEDLSASQRALRMVMTTLSEGVRQLRSEIESEKRT